jgi:hypothetical protein
VFRGLRVSEICQPVERALQDEDRRVLVDHRRALLAADIGGD